MPPLLNSVSSNLGVVLEGLLPPEKFLSQAGFLKCGVWNGGAGAASLGSRDAAGLRLGGPDLRLIGKFEKKKKLKKIRIMVLFVKPKM